MTTPSGIMFQLSSDAGPTNDTLNAAPATIQLAYSFIAVDTALDMFWIRCGSVAGTDSLRKITFELQADTGGIPTDTALGTYEVTAGWSVGQRAISPGWSGVGLTVGDRYWIVCKNTSVAPTVDTVGFSKSGFVFPQLYSATYGTVSADFVKRQWNGTNWTTSVLAHASALTLKFTNGDITGCPSVGAVGYDSSWVANTTRSIGYEFQIPYGSATLTVVAASIGLLNAQSLSIYAYLNRSQVAVSQYAANVPTTGTRVLTVPLAFVAQPGDWVAIMAGTTAAGSVQCAGQNITDHADFHSLKQMKLRAVKLDSGTTWTELETRIPYGGIHLHPTQPFLPPVNRRTSTGR